MADLLTDQERRLTEGSPSDIWTQQEVYEFVAALRADRDAWEERFDKCADDLDAALADRDTLATWLRRICGEADHASQYVDRRDVLPAILAAEGVLARLGGDT